MNHLELQPITNYCTPLNEVNAKNSNFKKLVRQN